MRTDVTRHYTFEAGHWLPKVPDGHKCKRPHGHNYEIDITVAGRIGDDGFIIDFWDLDKIVDPVIAMIDHRMLNDIVGLENPTAEYIAAWFYDKIVHSITKLGHTVECVRVYETKNCWADAYPGEEELAHE